MVHLNRHVFCSILSDFVRSCYIRLEGLIFLTFILRELKYSRYNSNTPNSYRKVYIDTNQTSGQGTPRPTKSSRVNEVKRLADLGTKDSNVFIAHGAPDVVSRTHLKYHEQVLHFIIPLYMWFYCTKFKNNL
jgi:hypothetical protein